MSNRTQPNPTSTWRAAVARAREVALSHHSTSDLELMLWRQGFGPRATAQIVDLYVEYHPSNRDAEEDKK